MLLPAMVAFTIMSIGEETSMPQTTTDNDAFARLPEIIADAAKRNRNEAETRHKIIDFILHDLLAWPRNRVAVEENIHPGFADYILKRTNGDPLVFVEAKKEGLYFELPLPHNGDETSANISIKKLLTDPNIKVAANQVRTYCADTGCEYARITNGHEWIFFKTFEKNVRWDSLNALVIRGLEFLSANTPAPSTVCRSWLSLSGRPCQAF
jgi:hypothetical protein